MPDLEVLVCGGGSSDGKVSCETMIAGEGPPAAEEDPDLPAESFQLRIGDEIGWVDINAVYDRDDSTKGLANPKSHQHHQKPPVSASQRFSGSLAAPKAHIIGLPNKIQHSSYVGHSARRPTKGLIFPKVAGAGGGGGGGRKTAVPESEPTSPKVSCFGKVLSERERERCRRRHQGTARAAELEERGGCWASLAAFFRCGEVERAVEPITSAPSAGSMTSAWPSTGNETMVVPPGLGGMRQFASSRRSASWGGDVDVEVEVEGHVPLDREEMWGRRSVGSLEDAVGRRDR